jgi:hypothetical protein
VAPPGGAGAGGGGVTCWGRDDKEWAGAASWASVERSGPGQDVLGRAWTLPWVKLQD